MAYYDALKAAWPALQGDTAAKLAALNAQTVAGPNVDVQVSSVVGKLMLSGAYLVLQGFSAGSPTGVQVHDTALASAQLLVALMGHPNAPIIEMSKSDTFATVKGMLDAILAQEAVASGSTGITQAVHDALLALCATTVPWYQGNGYPSPLNSNDLQAAGVS